MPRSRRHPALPLGKRRCGQLCVRVARRRTQRGERALDRRSLIIKLAEALDVAPSEITGSTLAAPGERDDDRALTEVRLALLAVSMDAPHGEVQPVEQLATRVSHLLAAQNDCQAATVGTALPSLIRDLHATADTHRGEHELLRLLTLTHMQGTQAWLTTIGAPPERRRVSLSGGRDGARPAGARLVTLGCPLR